MYPELKDQEIRTTFAPPAANPPVHLNFNLNRSDAATNTVLPEQKVLNAPEVEASGRGRHRHHHHRHHHHRSEPKPSREHVMNQVDKILGSVASGNIVGIVDESLKIRTSEPVRNLVTGIMSSIFHPVDRFLGRNGNKPSQSHGISGRAT